MFSCELCNYHGAKAALLKAHLKTKKHRTNVGVVDEAVATEEAPVVVQPIIEAVVEVVEVIESPEKRAARIEREDDERREAREEDELFARYKMRKLSLSKYGIERERRGLTDNKSAEYIFLSHAIGANRAYKYEEDEYDRIGKRGVLGSFEALDVEARGRWYRFAEEYGCFDY